MKGRAGTEESIQDLMLQLAIVFQQRIYISQVTLTIGVIQPLQIKCHKDEKAKQLGEMSSSSKTHQTVFMPLLALQCLF